MNVAYRLGVRFQVVDELLKNPHRLAEFIRFTLRSKAASVIQKWLKANATREGDRNYTDLMLLYHSDSELAAFRKMLTVKVGAAEAVPINVEGYRPEAEAHASDRARGGRPVTRASLAQSRLFFGGDMLYHLNSGDFAALFACHPEIKKGVTLLLAARHFDPNPDSLHLDWFQWGEQSESEMVLRVPVRRTEPALDEYGAPIVILDKKHVKENRAMMLKHTIELGRWEKRARDKRGPKPPVPALHKGRITQRIVNEIVDEVVKVPALAQVNYVEGHGLVGQDGVIEFFSSCYPGDAVYKHAVKGMEFFTHTHIAEEVVVDGVKRFLQISIHVEWNCGPMVLLKVDIQQLDAPGITVRYDRPAPSFVQRGVITTLLPNLCAKAQGMDLEKAESIEALYNTSFRMMVQSLGKANFDRLSKYHEFLMNSSRRSAEKSIVLSRVEIRMDVPLHSSFKDAAQRFHSLKVSEDTGCPAGVASAYVRLTDKQTRASFIVECFRAGVEGLSWLWSKLRGAFVALIGLFKAESECCEVVPLNLISSLVKLLSAAQRRSKWLSGAIHHLFSPIQKLSAVRNAMLKTDRWFSSHPRARLVFEELALVLQSIVVALGEECAKRYTPLGFSVLFGAIEALVESVAHFLDEPVSRHALAREIAKGLIRVAAHTLLRLIPIWVSVPIHGLINYLAGRRKPRIWSYLMDLLAIDALEQELDAFIGDPEYIHLTAPSNRVSESGLYLKDPDGTELPLAECDFALERCSIPADSKRVVSVSSDCDALLVVPSGTVLDAVMMEVLRLEKPLPYEGSPQAWASAMLVFHAVFVDILIDERGYLRPYDLDQMIAYVETRPWPSQRKEETIEILRRWKNGSKLHRPKEMTMKQNEIIPNQPDQVEPTVQDDEGAVASKTRPIMPRAEADLPAMALAVPLKAYMGGQRFWGDFDGVFKPVDPDANLGWVLSIDYQYMPRADALGRWFNRCRKLYGVHVAMHGDDNYTLVVAKDGSLTASGIDLVNCDKSCGEPMQDSFCDFANSVTGLEYADEIARQKSLLTGEIEIKTKEGREMPKIFWRKTKISTNTGEPLTSIKAVFAQYPGVFVSVRACIIDGEFRPHLYKLMVMKKWRELGLIPEFEEDQYGSVWHHPSAVTFLGGMFVETFPETHSDWCWVSNKHLKAYYVFPDVDRIYGPKLGKQMHMSVLMADPDLPGTPVGRALLRWYSRVTRACFGAEFHSTQRHALQRYERHRIMEDRYKLEMERDLGVYMPSCVSDDAYVHAVGYMLNRHDRFELRSDIMRMVREMDTFDNSPIQELSTSALALYVLRFGEPKRKTSQIIPDKDKGERFSLNLVGSLFNLSAKIFTYFNQNTSSPDQDSDDEVSEEAQPGQEGQERGEAGDQGGRPREGHQGGEDPREGPGEGAEARNPNATGDGEVLPTQLHQARCCQDGLDVVCGGPVRLEGCSGSCDTHPRCIDELPEDVLGDPQELRCGECSGLCVHWLECRRMAPQPVRSGGQPPSPVQAVPGEFHEQCRHQGLAPPLHNPDLCRRWRCGSDWQVVPLAGQLRRLCDSWHHIPTAPGQLHRCPAEWEPSLGERLSAFSVCVGRTQSPAHSPSSWSPRADGSCDDGAADAWGHSADQPCECESDCFCGGQRLLRLHERAVEPCHWWSDHDECAGLGSGFDRLGGVGHRGMAEEPEREELVGGSRHPEPVMLFRPVDRGADWGQHSGLPAGRGHCGGLPVGAADRVRGSSGLRVLRDSELSGECCSTCALGPSFRFGCHRHGWRSASFDFQPRDYAQAGWHSGHGPAVHRGRLSPPLERGSLDQQREGSDRVGDRVVDRGTCGRRPGFPCSCPSVKGIPLCKLDW
jgi:hypothetical protein